MKARDLIAELDTHFVRLMRNWARAGAGCTWSGPGVISSIYAGNIGHGRGEAPAPIINGEARDVDQALLALRKRERQAVTLFWQYEDNTMEWFARRLGCGYRTVGERVHRGHEELGQELTRRRLALQRSIAANALTLAEISARIISPDEYAKPFASKEIDNSKLQV